MNFKCVVFNFTRFYHFCDIWICSFTIYLNFVLCEMRVMLFVKWRFSIQETEIHGL